MRTNCSQVVIENFFEPGILYLLLKKPSYGYEIQKELKKNCICEVNIGNLYRCLSRMQKQGYIKREGLKSDIGPKRFSYSITKEGKIYLSSWIDSLKKQKKVISSLINNYKKII
ncbi:MAG: PadR family transcriptional regulator [Candidatus Roizmanbacteria bacterium]|nr:PadR family transcriptional regulator [Candidatus Roizmanbacteria bacterium]